MYLYIHLNCYLATFEAKGPPSWAVRAVMHLAVVAQGGAVCFLVSIIITNNHHWGAVRFLDHHKLLLLLGRQILESFLALARSWTTTKTVIVFTNFTTFTTIIMLTTLHSPYVLRQIHSLPSSHWQKKPLQHFHHFSNMIMVNGDNHHHMVQHHPPKWYIHLSNHLPHCVSE